MFESFKNWIVSNFGEDTAMMLVMLLIVAVLAYTTQFNKVSLQGGRRRKSNNDGIV